MRAARPAKASKAARPQQSQPAPARVMPVMASFFAVVFAGAAGEQLLETLGGWSRETSVADRMWSEMGADMVEYDPDEERGKALIDSAQAGQYKSDVQSFLVDQYATLHYDKMVERSCIQGQIKEGLVEGLVSKLKDEVFRRLASSDQEQKTLEQQIGEVFNVHRGIETAAKEEGVLKGNLRYYDDLEVVNPLGAFHGGGEGSQAR